MNKPVTPRSALASILARLGVSRLCVAGPLNEKRLADLGLQEVALSILLEERAICRNERRVTCRPLVSDGGVEIAVPGQGGVYEYIVSPRMCPFPIVSWRDLYQELPNPPLPAIVVDVGERVLAQGDGVHGLKMQLASTISVIRRYLWDPHLVLSSVTDNVKELVSEVVEGSKVQVRGERPGRILWAMSADKVVILRPDAEKPLSESEVLEADAFLISGFQDEIPGPETGRFLDSAVPWGRPRRLELHGSLVGVPKRVNRIVEIIMRVMFTGVTVEEAIVATMTRSDAQRRLQVEVLKAHREGAVGRQHFEYLKRWLPIDCREYVEAALKAGVNPGWECEGKDSSG